ncbi:MAG: cupin domain-containing protein [Chloroflexota bacterium]|nr:cupin domain-containing protein [Chloroflexota bacterium]
MQEGERTCKAIGPGQEYSGKQGLVYGAGVSAESVGASGICMHLVTIPPGGRARAHLHEHHETALYILTGKSEVWYGESLEERLWVRAGEFMYIPEGMPHLPTNPDGQRECVAVLARTDPNEQESVVPLPELDELFASRQGKHQ